MRRALLVGIVVAAAAIGSGCSTVDNKFHVEGNTCIRTRTEYVAGIRTSKQSVLAVPENCGLSSK